MSSPNTDASIVIGLTGDKAQLIKDANEGKKEVEKTPAKVKINGDISGLNDSITKIQGALDTISKSFASSIKSINQSGNKIKFKNLETSISNLENLFAELKDSMTIVDSEGKRLLRVNGIKSIYTQINKVGESLVNIKDVLDSIAQKQGVLSARSVTTIQKDIEETTKKAKTLQDTLANISSSKKFSQSKQDLGEYFDSKSAKSIAQKIISNDDNVGSISGIDKFVKNVIRVYAQGEEEISKYSFEFQEKAYSLTQIVNEIFATGKAYDNTFIPGLDALKLMNSAISDQTTGLQALNKELEIAKGKESSAFKVSIDTDSLNNLSEALKNLNVKIGEGTSLGFNTEDIDRITTAFNEVKSVLEETLKPLSALDLKNLGSIFSSEEVKPFLDTITNIEQQLINISKTLGVIDDSNAFNNILTSIDKLFAKLSRMQQKIGTGVYNVEIKQGENFGSSQDLLISNERDRLLKSYDKIVKSFGDEEKLFSSMENVLSKTSGFGANANELFQLFSKSSVAAIENPMEQINRIREFLTRFKEVRSELRQEVEILNKDLEYANQQVKETSNKEEKQNIRDRINNIKQELKYTSDLSNRIDKLSTPSSTNAFLNKKIESATESEKEFIRQMNELKSVDLSGVIEQLTNIHNEIKAIAQDKLLTELIQTLTEQLNSISAQFGNFLTQFKSTATDTSSITAEQQGLEKLRDLLLEIANAVDAKTSAFQIEEGVVTGVLQNEINKVDALGRKISDVTSGLNSLSNLHNTGIGIIPNEQNSSIKETITDEQRLDKVSTQVAQSIIDDFGATSDVFEKLKNEVKSLFEILASGESINLQGIFDIVSKSSGVADILKGYEDKTYNAIRSYVSKSQIHLSEGDASEFGNDLKNVRGVIGIKNLVNSGGGDALTFLDELRNKFGEVIGQATSTQEAIQLLYEYLKDKPNPIQNWMTDSNQNGLSNTISNRIQSGYGLLSQGNTGSSELTSLSAIRDLIIEIQNEIVTKNAKFQEEQGVVNQSVNSELEDLKRLESLIFTVGDLTDHLFKTIQNYNKDVKFDFSSMNFSSLFDNAEKLKNADIKNVLNDLIGEFKKFASEINNIKIDNSIISQINNLLNAGDKLKQLADILKNSDEKIRNASNAINGRKTGGASDRAKALQEEIQLTNKLNEIRAQLVQYTGSDNANKITDDMYVTSRQERINTIQAQITALGDLQKTEQEQAAFEEATYKKKQAYTDAVAKAQKAAMEAAIQKADADKKAAEDEQKISSEIDKTINSLKKQASTLKNNGKLMKVYGNQVDLLIEELKGIDRSVDPGDIKSRLAAIRNELGKIQAEANLSGNTGKTIKQMLTGRFKSLIAYLGSFASFYRIVGYVRSAITTIQDLDTQLIDLRKTTKMSARELDEFYKSSSDIAKQMGVTTSEIIQQAAAWSRLGYNTKEASTQMAELSSQFASISPGVTVDKGTDYLVSTMQAFGVQTDEVKRKIMDNVNAVGKELPKHMVTYGVIYR